MLTVLLSFSFSPHNLPRPPIMSAAPTTAFDAHPPPNRTFARQGELPKLPIPPLEDTCRRYLRALEGLQDEREHAKTKQAVEAFLHGEGPRIQERLKEWAKTKDRYAVHRIPRNL
jgi:carnitine O-acetyltransferase